MHSCGLSLTRQMGAPNQVRSLVAAESMGVRLMKRVGATKPKVAVPSLAGPVAHKLPVILHCIWTDGTDEGDREGLTVRPPLLRASGRLSLL